jgi:hypothetical protein
MSHNKPDLRRLLNDVLPAAGEHCGPERARVLEMVKQETGRRRGRRLVVATATTLLAVAGLIFVARPPTPERPTATVPKPSAIVVNNVDDEQLLTLLKDMPVALMEWPNGERTLLLVSSERELR